MLITWLNIALALFLVSFYISCEQSSLTPSNEEPSPKMAKVAVLLPQTGPQAGIGRGAMNSVRLAFDLAKDEFSQHGLTFEILALDDASKPETAVSAAQRACSDKDVILAIAHFNSPCALATVSIFHEAGLPVIVPAAINSRVTADGFPEIFRTCNTDIGQAVWMAKYLLDVRKAERIFAVHDSSSFGKGLIEALTGEFESRNVHIVGEDAFHSGDVDFSSVLARIKNSDPDTIVIGCMAAEGALFRKQMVEKRMNADFVGFSGIFYETFIENAGYSADGVNAIFPLPPLEEIPGGKIFLKAYEDAGFNEPFESAGPFGYVAGQVAVHALSHSDLTRSGIIEYLRGNTFDTAFGKLNFDKQGEMTLSMFAFYEVRAGKWTITHRVDEAGEIVPAK